MTGAYRVLLSCASEIVRGELFEAGRYTYEEAEVRASIIMRASPGVIAYVAPEESDPRTILHEKGWI